MRQLVSLEEALDAVAELAPIARQYGQKAEDARDLPAEVVDAIMAAGLWGIFAPAEVGGGGLIGADETFEIVRALAYADTSTAWSLFICATSPAVLASKLPADGIAEVFADGIGPMSLCFTPAGRSAPAEGGLRVSGRWPFASGIGYAGWVVANTVLLGADGAPELGPDGQPELVSVAVRTDEVTVIDDWHVAGLRGTGSMSFTMDDVFVPARRTFPFFAPSRLADTKYRIPLFSLVAPGFAGVAIGTAERALDEVRAVLPGRAGPPKHQPASQDPVIQRTVGHAQAAIRGARESTRAVFDSYVERRLRGEDLHRMPIADRCELHQHVVWAAQTCRDAVDELFRVAGASAIYESSPIQRIWRDSTVLNQHLYLRDTHHESAGRLALGLDAANPTI
ncbi:alkylation response protein AidB-like acyl-CoA dehydrogenase [Nocardia tenerifensis]|uniref:Alkylation response protein AidB-like acyl-CoA dehydrogenase n=1 Tax=Nocardia tenerifensis TaxID=228006 RepID=A0A318KN83_9NOCA|nr:acyl-CoA dehydrogenase family protein [Nocardia tenerifensis]PXX71130.1 alkylation response protein AidB-like acyl-CoA dehydrogenase [Nocardia tenerifensis]